MSQSPENESNPPIEEDGLYEVVEPKEPAVPEQHGPLPGGAGDDSTEWFVGLPDGNREGPLSLATMKQRIAAGSLSRADLVWKAGMSGWTPAGQVPGLFETSMPGPNPPPLEPHESGPESDDADVSWQVASAQVMDRCDSFFNHPRFFRVFGRLCAGLAVVFLAITPLAAIVGSTGWFVYVFWCLLLFLVGEAAAAILDRMERTTNDKQ